MKVGDLVINIEEPEHGLGIVLQTNVEMWGHPQEPPGIKVLWPVSYTHLTLPTK